MTKVVKLASNENPLGPSKLVIEAIIKEASNVNIYPDPSVDALKEKLSKKYNFKKSEIIVGKGGEEILKMMAMTFINKGDEAIMSNPTFALYDITVSHMGGVSVKLPLKDFEQDLDKRVEICSDQCELNICKHRNGL